MPRSLGLYRLSRQSRQSTNALRAAQKTRAVVDEVETIASRSVLVDLGAGLLLYARGALG